MMIGKAEYSIFILQKLQKLESLSSKYEDILRLISKRIRRDLWNTGKNDFMLYKMLDECGKQLENDYKEKGEYTEDIFIDFIGYLRTYTIFLGVNLPPFYFEKFVSDVRLENARVIIEKQWDDILNVSENSDKAFIDIFDDVFSKCMEKYEDVFLYSLSEDDVLCRVVPDWNWGISRFVPWDNASTVNRWNPPGKTYLYLSFETKEKVYSEDLSINEYICLEEYRAKKGKSIHFVILNQLRQVEFWICHTTMLSSGKYKWKWINMRKYLKTYLLKQRCQIRKK